MKETKTMEIEPHSEQSVIARMEIFGWELFQRETNTKVETEYFYKVTSKSTVTLVFKRDIRFKNNKELIMLENKYNNIPEPRYPIYIEHDPCSYEDFYSKNAKIFTICMVIVGIILFSIIYLFSIGLAWLILVTTVIFAFFSIPKRFAYNKYLQKVKNDNLQRNIECQIAKKDYEEKRKNYLGLQQDILKKAKLLTESIYKQIVD